MAGGCCCVRVQGVEGPGLGFLVEHCNVQLCLPFPVWEMFLWEGQLVTCYADFCEGVPLVWAGYSNPGS